MKKFVNKAYVFGLSLMSAVLLAGCGEGKVLETTYEYNPSDYIELADYKNLSVDYETVTLEDNALETAIANIREYYTEYNQVDRPIQEGDKVIVDFDAYISGTKVEGFSGSEYVVYVGSGDFYINGFEEALIGLSTGDSRAISGLVVPEDFTTVEGYAGKTLTFNVDIIEVDEPVLPEYTDEFVSNITKGEFTTVDSYNEELQKQMEEDAVEQTEDNRKNALLENIITNTKVVSDLPSDYVYAKQLALEEEITKYTTLYSISEEEYLSKYCGTESAEEYAKNQVLLELILQNIIENEGLTVTEKYYNDHIDQIASDANYSSTEKYIEVVGKTGAVKAMLANKALDIIYGEAEEN